ncbi:DUF4158 domain-containing protein [Streptomyces sp. NPDC048825]|uniref:DUF4158 domain-containing protein n=1 Tax=Streptomyces sp. NPDC048825 TaxID=3365592 RepID=UPI003724325A
MFSWRLGPGQDCDLDRADRVPPRFKRLITAHELHLFFSPTRDELEWAAGATDGDEHLLAVLLTLKLCQRMGYFPTLEDVPEQVVAKRRGSVGKLTVADSTDAARRPAPAPPRGGRLRVQSTLP